MRGSCIFWTGGARGGGAGRAAWGFRGSGRRADPKESHFQMLGILWKTEFILPFRECRRFLSLSRPPVASFIMAYRKTGKKKRERERKKATSIWVSCIKWETAEREETRSGRGGYRTALLFPLRVYLSVLRRACFGFQESVSQQMPVRGSGGRWWLQHGAE